MDFDHNEDYNFNMSIKDRARTVAIRIRESHSYFPVVVSSKDSVLSWLKHARRAQIVLAAGLFLGWFVVTPLFDSMANGIYQPQKQRRISQRRKARQSADRFSGVLSSLYWFAAAGTTLVFLWFELPIAASRIAAGGTSQKNGSAKTIQTSHMALAGGPPGDIRDDFTTANTVMGEVGTHLGNHATMAATQEISGTDPTVLASDSISVSGGRYAILGEIGRGGMGVVYRARDTLLDRTVALKALPPGFNGDGVLVDRFRQEARSLAQLVHPNIVQVYDLVQEQSRLYMAIELVPGKDLDRHIEDEGKLSVKETLRLSVEMAEALAYAHEKGVVHRDFKPQNVLLTPDGQPKVTDFGLAKRDEGPKLTMQGAVMGSPAYMSPEQSRGKSVDARTDIYAFGITLYEMLTGRTPFEGAAVEVVIKHSTQQHPPITDFALGIPDELVSLIDHMLAKDPDDRIADMTTVAGRLREIASAHGL